MDRLELVGLLSSSLPNNLAEDLAEHFIELRRDVATQTFGRTGAGKFVETLVQVLQYLETGKFESKPKVDEFLRSADTKAPSLDDGLRICAARVGRAMYALRSKRSIAHKGTIDPNSYDLQFLFSAAQWALAEIVRNVGAHSMAEAGKLVAQIQAPIGGMVEDFGDRALVLTDLPVREEVLVLLHHHYPKALTVSQVSVSLERRNPATVRKVLRQIWDQKLAQGGGSAGYHLTRRGFDEAIAVIGRCLG